MVQNNTADESSRQLRAKICTQSASSPVSASARASSLTSETYPKAACALPPRPTSTLTLTPETAAPGPAALAFSELPGAVMKLDPGRSKPLDPPPPLPPAAPPPATLPPYAALNPGRTRDIPAPAGSDEECEEEAFADETEARASPPTPALPGGGGGGGILAVLLLERLSPWPSAQAAAARRAAVFGLGVGGGAMGCGG